MGGRQYHKEDRKYADGPALRMFWIKDGKERLYNARVARYTNNDELVLEEDGSIKAYVKMTVGGKTKQVSGKGHRIGNRWQFVPNVELVKAEEG